MAKIISEKDLRLASLKDPEIRKQLRPIKKPQVHVSPEEKQLQAVEKLLKLIEGNQDAFQKILISIFEKFLQGTKEMRETMKVEVNVPKQTVVKPPHPITGFKIIRDSNKLMTNIEVLR